MTDKAELLEELEKNYSYDPDTGYFTRILKTSPNNNIGDIAGYNGMSRYYVVLVLKKRSYNAHRLAWLLMTGAWPKDQIDHINRNKRDNRFVNLRECTAQQNNRNRTASTKNKSGYKCVYWRGIHQKWLAAICIEGKYIEIGLFDCRHDAARAYNAKAKEADSEFCCLNEVPV